MAVEAGDGRKEESAETQLLEFTDSSAERVLKLIKEEFPKKVIEMNKFLNSDFFKAKWLDEVKAESNVLNSKQASQTNEQPATNHETRGKRKRLTSDQDTSMNMNHSQPTEMSSNKSLKELIAAMKPRITKLVEETNLIKIWILLMIPKIEDGNNFGVSVQEEILEEVRAVEQEGAVYFDEISKYHSTRAKIVSKIFKYPFIEDYRDTLTEIDEKEWLHLQLVCKEVRNHYNVLFDLITKNWEKLICPRSSNADTMF
ncbi:proteasome regulator gamma [Brevipalpus obovatus]|uniref:proteasome regulator gamma n=1 Tax=Brevipalpus obovatus TaxID=246614 RepID=UPI003D9F3503